MLEVAVLNAHIMYQGAGHQGVSLGDFKELLVEQLIGGNMDQIFILTGNSVTIQ